jgi:hypothetical protein
LPPGRKRAAIETAVCCYLYLAVQRLGVAGI